MDMLLAAAAAATIVQLILELIRFVREVINKRQSVKGPNIENGIRYHLIPFD